MEPLLKRRARTAVPSTHGRRRINATMVRRPMSASGRRPGVPGGTGWAAADPPEGGVEDGASSNSPITPPASMAARGLHRAVEKCRFHQLKFLMDSGTRLSLRNDNGESALVTALRIPADRSREKMFNFLLRRGAGCDDRDPATGRDILLWACHLGRDVQVRKLLQVCLGDLAFHRRDNTGRTCLHYAVEAGWIETVALMARGMRRFGLSVDVPDANGVTPFIQAKRLEDGDIQQVLVTEGNASPSQFDLDELHLIGSSAACTSSSTKTPTRPRYVVPHRTRRIYPASTSSSGRTPVRFSRAISSSVSAQETSRATSSDWGANDEDSSTSSAGNTWTMTGTKYKHWRKPSPGVGRKGHQVSSQEAQWRRSRSSSAWTEDAGRGVGPITSTPVASYGSSFIRSSSCGGSPMTQSYSGKATSCSHNASMSLSNTIDVTRTQSTPALDYGSNNGIRGAVSQGVGQALSSSAGASADDDTNAVQEMFNFMSLQLTPAYRPKADPKNAYKAPPKPKPKPKAAWGMVGLFSRLKAKSQRIRMQTKAKGERRQSTQLDASQMPNVGKSKLLGRLKQQVTT